MNFKRTAIIFVGGAALAAWLSAAIAPSRPPIVSEAIRPGPVDVSGAALASEIARLRERLRPSPAPRETLRNPFVFRTPRRSVSSFTLPPAAPAGIAGIPGIPGIDVAAANIPDTGFRLTLAGIAEDGANGTSVRTAIISGNGQLFLARPGDVVNDGGNAYTVGTISADAVELTAVRDGTTRQLTLK